VLKCIRKAQDGPFVSRVIGVFADLSGRLAKMESTHCFVIGAEGAWLAVIVMMMSRIGRLIRILGLCFEIYDCDGPTLCLFTL